MLNFYSQEKLCSVDKKGRVRLPSSIISVIGEEKAKFFMIKPQARKGILQVYPVESWEKRSEKLGQIDLMLEENREYVRRQMLGFTRVERDGSGRITIPKHLLERLGFDGQVMVTSFMDVIEFWHPEKYYDYLEDESYDSAGEARRIFGDGNLKSGQNSSGN